MSKPPAQPNRSLQNGIECLLQLAVAQRPVGSREMARELGLESTRVNRLLGTLAFMGLARRTSDRKYVPGAGLHVLTALSLRGSHLLGAALPHLRSLSRATGGARVALGVLWRAHVCYLYHGVPGAEAESGIAGQGPYPLAFSSIGRILAAYLAPEEVRALSAREPSAVPDVEAFLELLPAFRKQGYALAWNDGSIAVSIGSPPVAGLALMDEQVSAEEKVPFLVEQLKEAAVAIDRDLQALECKSR